MKIIKDNNGYITSLLVILLLIPIFLLLLLTVEEYNHQTDNEIDSIENKKIQSKLEDFQNEIITVTKQSLHELTLETITSKKAVADSRKTLKNRIQNKTLQKADEYKDVKIVCQITNIKESSNPFIIEVEYVLNATDNNSNIIINKKQKQLVEITDQKYPVYDPLPTLKTGATFKDNKVYFKDKLSNYLKSDESNTYLNVIEQVIIKECPYDAYQLHGNDNKTISSCLKNHYYHNSHDGMCLLCRLENRTGCEHYGFETFIIPVITTKNQSPTSIDHVLLNNQNNQYDGNKIIIDNDTTIYLDNGHKAKYGL